MCNIDRLAISILKLYLTNPLKIGMFHVKHSYLIN
jgi:hypothetical protein